MRPSKHFMVAILSILALLGIHQRQAAAQKPALINQADTVLYNGKIVTVDPKFRIVQAVAIRDGKFIAVGTNRDIRALAGPTTTRIDLRGRTVLPGLIDTHAHIVTAGDIGHTVSFAGAKTVADALARVKAFAAGMKPGDWIVGNSGWAPATQLVEHRFLTAKELDTVAPANPVFLPAGGHFAMTNSAGLKLAGIGKTTPVPAGGVIERDDAGDPTGVVQESAIELVREKIPPLSLEERVARMKQAMHYFNSFGLTSVVDGLTDPKQFRVFQSLWAAHAMTMRIDPMFMPAGNATTTPIADWEKTFENLGVASGFGDDWLRFAGIGEITSDGGMTLKTAFLRDPYPDDPKNHGTASIPADKLKQIAAICARFGWRMAVHAVGDAAIDRVLDAYEYANKQTPIVGKRWFIIHGSLIQADQLQRAKALGLRVEMQNVFMWDKAPTVARFIGSERANRAVPTKLMIDILGIDNVGAGTDFSVNTLNPFINMYIMVTRKDPSGTAFGVDQAITRQQAIRLYTTSASHATFDEQRKGSIEAGKLADLVVLSADILKVPEDAIKEIQIVRTVVGGKTVFQR